MQVHLDTAKYGIPIWKKRQTDSSMHRLLLCIPFWCARRPRQPHHCDVSAFLLPGCWIFILSLLFLLLFLLVLLLLFYYYVSILRKKSITTQPLWLWQKYVFTWLLWQRWAATTQVDQAMYKLDSPWDFNLRSKLIDRNLASEPQSISSISMWGCA